TWKDNPDIVLCCRVLHDIMGAQHYLTSHACLADAAHALNKSPTFVAERISSTLTSPPGDILFVPTPTSVGFNYGAAWLRAIREVRLEDVAVKLSELRPGGAMRVARLGPIFRYKLTQQLGQVFSDIGLPKDYESDLKTYNADKSRQFNAS